MNATTTKVKVTRDLIGQALAGGSCLNAKQFAIIGVTWPPRTGWLSRAIGRELSTEDAERFVSLKTIRKPGKSAKAKRTSAESNAAKGLSHPALSLIREPLPGWWLLRFDGSCDGNGRRDATGGWGFHIQDATYHTLKEGHGRTHEAVVTNNVSEWTGLAEGLTAVGDVEMPSPAGLLIEGDSMLVIQTLTGRWASKKPELTALRDECRDRLKELGVPWFARWIPREENEYCDAMT